MPLYRIDVGATPRASDINQIVDGINGLVDFGQVVFAAPVAAPVSAGTAASMNGAGLSIGTFTYAVSFVTGVRRSDGTLYVTGETPVSPTWTTLTTSGYQRVAIANLPNGAPTVIGKRIYRSDVNGNASTLKLVATLPATQTTYVDSTPEAERGAAPSATNTTGTWVTLCAPPTDPLHAVNKQFVDTEMAANRAYMDQTETDIRAYMDQTEADMVTANNSAVSTVRTESADEITHRIMNY